MLRNDGQDFAPGNLFTDGNPAVPTPASVLGARWLNMVQEEVANAIEAEGITLDDEDDTQLAQAIAAAVVRIGAPLIATSRGTKYFNANATLPVGRCLIDTSAGPLNMALPAAPALGDSITVVDPKATWGTNVVNLLRNGHTIMGLAEDLILNMADIEFTIWWNGADWRLL